MWQKNSEGQEVERGKGKKGKSKKTPACLCVLESNFEGK